jgi:predicted metalloendopeptidase
MPTLLRSTRLRRLFFASAILSVTACFSQTQAQEVGKKGLISGVELENFDMSVSPDEDFFRFVNGAWLDKTKIPSDQSNYGAFTALDIETKEAIKKIIEEASTQSNPSAIAKQVGDFYRSYTDTAQRNKAGIEPIQGMLSQIKAISSKEQLIQVAGKLSRRGVSSFYGFYIEPDAKRSDQYAIYVNQDGTTLPDRDYYLEDNERFQKTLAAYLKFVETMLAQVGWQTPAEVAAKIVEMERSFAQSQWTQVELRNPDNTYNKMPATEIASKYASVRWSDFATAAGLPTGLDVIVGQPSFMVGASNTITESDLETLKAYLAFQMVDTYAPLLTEKMEKLHFDFHETTLSGVTEQEPLWRRGVDACNGLLGMPVGQLYVEKHFSPKSKEKMNTLVKNLMVAFEKRIDQLEWMGNGTKKQAQEKLAQFTPKIGYPDVWKDYSSVKIVPDNIIANMGEILEFEHNYQINKLGKPINRSEWYMPPQTVNAYYNPLMNEIVFPAAILQPPFFNLEADDAVNYGGIGAVIGHEISHGFDDSGRKYDGKGNLRNWWTTADQEEFEERSTKLVKQYDAYQPFPMENINGKFTLGENIGDLGGMSVAYTAYKLSLEGKEAPTMDGFTGDQRFFIGWAQVWRRKYRDEELKKRLLTDPHSPSQYRCNGIVSNLDPFYTAFPIKPDSKMFIDRKSVV